MNIKKIAFFMIFLSIPTPTLLTIENEFILTNKEKKSEVSSYSRQQCIEQEGELSFIYSDVLYSLNRLSKLFVNLQRGSMEEIELFYNNEKSSVVRCATKRQRIVLHEKSEKRKKIIENVMVVIDKALVDLKSL